MSDQTASIHLSAPESAELLIASIQDYAIYVIDLAGHIASWNPGAEQIKGYSLTEVMGRPFSIFYTPEDRDAGVPGRELIAAAEGRYEAEGWRVRKDGSRFWASVVITPLREGSGAFLGFAKVTRDLTEKRKAEEERAAVERAQAVMRIGTDFIANAKRELDTVLATIRSHLRSLETVLGPLDDDTVPEIKAKATTLEWSLGLISRSMDSVVGIAAAAAQRLPGLDVLNGAPGVDQHRL